jgi:serine/threonine-protein kinase
MADEAAGTRLIKPKVIGRYALFGEIAAGGMATVHFGRLVGPVGFSRTVAIKRLHPQYAKDPEFLGMFLDEARLASRIAHPNVVKTLDVVNTPDEVFLVMEYVPGESLARLLKNAAQLGERAPPEIVVSVMAGMLNGLHAAHEAKSEQQEPLGIVHRDISPQNVLVGVDGAARVLDFGVAKAALRTHSTRDGQMKGKLAYMSPEQLNGRAVDRRTDLFAAGAVLWEALTCQRLFDGDGAGEILGKVLSYQIPDPATVVDGISPALSAIAMKALERDPEKRFQTAREFAIALETLGRHASSRTVGEWVERVAGVGLARRFRLVAALEGLSHSEELSKLAEAEALDQEVEPEAPCGPISGLRERLDSVSDEPARPSTHSSSSTSHVSNVALPSVPEDDAGGTRRRKVWLSALVAAAAVVVVLLSLLSRRAAAPAEDAARSPAGGSALAARGASAPPPAAEKSPEPMPLAAAPAAPAVAPSPPSRPEPVSQPAGGAAGPSEGAGRVPIAGKPVAKSAGRKPPKVDCDPPFAFDAKGIKRVKPGCF